MCCVIATQRVWDSGNEHRVFIYFYIANWSWPSFCPQSLCSEIKQRRRGVGSVLRLCQHLLDNQETCNLNADHQPMQLIIVNLERRWEAIVMQAVQWQTRLQRKLDKHAVSGTAWYSFLPTLPLGTLFSNGAKFLQLDVMEGVNSRLMLRLNIQLGNQLIWVWLGLSPCTPTPNCNPNSFVRLA